jgi:hypothetical protein
MPMQTFLVRLWSSDDEPASDDLHGVLESAAPRKLQPFRDEAELLSLLKASLRREDTEDQGHGEMSPSLGAKNL